MKTLFDPKLTFEEAKELIRCGENVNETSIFLHTPLCCVNDLAVAKLFIEHGANVHHVDKDGLTPLHWSSNIQIAELLIKHGADINAKDKDGYLPLYYLNKVTNHDFITYLITAGSDINTKSKEDGSILSIIHKHYNLDTSSPKLLIQYGAVASDVPTYQKYRDLFTKEQQKAFDAFASITGNDDDFFQMCLAFQENIKNNVKMDVKDINII